MVDPEGRVLLPAFLREDLHLHPGSTLYLTYVDPFLAILAPDGSLNESSSAAIREMNRAGLDVEDIVAELPEARAEIAAELYGDLLKGLDHTRRDETAP
jgi:bifunctional DNA-binding transcriptional regulator/antitoxin component of YhaV-PrlF toxin-antitoxin module